METLKLLIADGTEDFRLALADTLRGAYQVRHCADGNQAKELLRSFRPDVLVLDLMISGLDGVSLLQWAVSRDIRPMVLATTRFVSDYVLESVDRLGVEYLMLKPCDIQATADRVGELSARIRPALIGSPDPGTLVTNLLLTMGVPTKLRGYAYLREAIVLMLKDPSQSLTKILYPSVAKICGCAATHVERSIRSAITAAWERRDAQQWQLYFLHDRTDGGRRPTNGEFITRLTEILRQEMSDAESGRRFCDL